MDTTKKILLIVDNDEDWLTLLERFLQGHGFGVVLAQDHAGAVKAAEKARPHCAIVDLKLGCEDGLGICRYIKESPALRDIPVIMLSGQDGLPDGSGCDAFVCKADGVERLLSAINKLLNLK